MKDFRLLLTVNIAQVLSLDETLQFNSRDAQWRAALPKSHKSFLDMAERSGLMAAFRTALGKAAIETPRNVERYFLNSMLHPKRSVLPRPVLELLMTAFEGARIEFFQLGAVGAVVANGSIRLLLPLCYTHPQKGARLLKAALPASESLVAEWMSSKDGHIPEEHGISLAHIQSQLGVFVHPL